MNNLLGIISSPGAAYYAVNHHGGGGMTNSEFWGGMIAITVGMIFFTWLTITLYVWLFEDYPKRQTLVEVLVSQWDWFKKVRIW